VTGLKSTWLTKDRFNFQSAAEHIEHEKITFYLDKIGIELKFLLFMA
jgi:hypothetical protein